MQNRKKFVEHILNFYNTQGRDFPWRKISDPYKIFLTEILLRKTTSKQVNSIYVKFFSEYPTIDSLALAEENELENSIKCLGLSKQRSKQMIKLANIITKQYGGLIPKNYNELIKLPGVGMYTAGGVLCLVYNKDVSMVDTNVIRVISRYFNFRSTKKDISTDKNIWEFVKDMVPPGKCKEFNFGLIDFAGIICRQKDPHCKKCGLNDKCHFSPFHD